MKKLFLLVAFVAGCAASQKEVAVKGNDLDLARVAGDWDGQYTGTESGRTGQVSFSLQVGSHVAEGQVVMNGATPLKIEFVKIQQDQVKGTIAPYTDPQCSCQVETTFLGNIDENVINGSFETKISATGQTQTGTWSVSRKRS